MSLTKKDLEDMMTRQKEERSAEFKELSALMQSVRNEVKDQLTNFREEIRIQLTDIRQEVHEKVSVIELNRTKLVMYSPYWIAEWTS